MDGSTTLGLAAVLTVLASATGFGLWRRRRDGVAVSVPAQRTEPDGTETDRPGSGDRAVLAELGIDPDPAVRVTLLQFSSAFCAPCRATRVICGRVAAEQSAVRHLEVDAESHLAAVRALGVWRTPTLFVVAADGRIASRITGQPRLQQVVDAIAPFLPGPASEPATSDRPAGAG